MTTSDPGRPGVHEQTRTVIVGGDGAETAPLPLPDRIGTYRILGVLGEGGGGIVYEAEQASPRRTVALKVVLGGRFVDESSLRSFQREADTLARLKHPSIAAVYESGRTEEGRHFFAMELVRGPMLHDHLGGRAVRDRAELASRLGLFRTICEAVQYAHQRGVIHRDLKPSNIIVSEEAGGHAVKVLDFGLARITDSDVAAASRVTEVGVIRGTLSYMSPEQARGNPDEIDVRSDVYSLGVVLYETLVGKRPHTLNRSSVVEALRVICHEPPEPLRAHWPRGLRLDPDLETIVGKALAKEPDQRYPTAAALSDDIARYLGSQPILARPPSTAYQLRKAIARNRAASALAAVLVLSLLGFGIAMSLLYAGAGRARLEAERQARIARAVNDFLNQDLLAAADPTHGADRDITMRQVVDRAARQLSARFAGEPAVEAAIRRTLGQTYLGLGLFEPAEPQLRAALALHAAERGDEDAETLRTASALGTLEFYRGDYAAAARSLARTAGVQERVLGEGHQDTLATRAALADVLYGQGRLEEAGALADRVATTADRALGEGSEPACAARNILATVALDQGRPEEAEALYRRLLELQRARYGSDDAVAVLGLLNNLGQVHVAEGRFEDAERVTAEALERARRVLGGEHRETITYINNLAIAKRRLGKLDEAEALYREGFEVSKRKFGATEPSTLVSMVNLASFFARVGRCAERFAFLAETEALCRKHSPAGTPSLGLALRNLGTCHAALGRPAEAERAWLEAEKTLSAVLAPGDPMLVALHESMAAFYERTGRPEQAASWAARANMR